MLSGVILTGLGAIAVSIASLAREPHLAAILLGLLLVLGGGALVLHALGVNLSPIGNPIADAARFLGRVIATPFRWYIRTYHQQWPASAPAPRVKSSD